MIRKLPVIPTLVVALAVLVMVRLGFWQLDRLAQKQADIARYTAAQASPREVSWPANAEAVPAVLFHHARIDCHPAGAAVPISARNATGSSGIGFDQPCALAGGATAWVLLGWAADPAPRAWSGGIAIGTLAPRGRHDVRLIADPPLAGLQPNARPDPRDLPNNHFSYAIQWFLFAAIALVIYTLALRKRWRESGRAQS